MGILLGVDLVKELVETAILTGRTIGVSPVSLLLIASPESGKTSIVLERQCKAAVALSDVTGRGLMQLCKMGPEISHFILNDLITVMSHKQSVNNYTLSIINAMTEEGIMACAWPGQVETFNHGKRAVIACLTRTLARDQRTWWNRSGFSSRMLPFCFSHSPELSIKIKQAINRDSQPICPSEFLVPEKPTSVQIPVPLVQPISELASHRAIQLQEQGYRRLKQYRALVKAHALRRSLKCTMATRADLDFLSKIDAYISYHDARPL